MAHKGRFSPEEFAEYKRLYLTWRSAVSDLTDFENNIPPEEPSQELTPE